ncbi:MAG: hypothetical protein ACREOJ_20140 [Gemmatimonadaceae bacterium]
MPAIRSCAGLVATLAFVALGGCSKADKSSATPSSSGAATPSTTNGDDIVAALASYKLNESNVDKFIAVSQNLRQIATQHPEYMKDLEAKQDQADPKTLDDMVQRLNSIPPMKAALSQAGLSAKDYTLTMFSVMSAGMVYQMRKQGLMKADTTLPATTNADNVAFIAAHPDLLDKISKAMDDSSSQ